MLLDILIFLKVEMINSGEILKNFYSVIYKSSFDFIWIKDWVEKLSEAYAGF